MATGIYGARQRAALTMLVVGALLIALGLPQMFSVAAQATGSSSFPFSSECGSYTDGGWKIEIDDDETPPEGSFGDTEGVSWGDVTWSISSTALYTIINSPSHHIGYYLNYSYTGSGYQLKSAYLKAGESWPSFSLSNIPNQGSILLPKGISHVTLCFEGQTTTTTTTTKPTTTTTTFTTTTSTTTTLPPTTTTTTLPPTTTTSTTSTTTTSTTTTTLPPTTTTTTTLPPTTTTTTTLPPTTTTTTTLPPTTTTTTTLPPTTTTTTTTLPPTTTTSTTSTTTTSTTTTTLPSTTTTVAGPDTTTTSTTSTTTTTLPTTTTTSGGTTSTTAGGTTSTTSGATTTTVLGPDDPELPDTGVGLALSIASTGLGSILAGSGFMALRAGARARREGFDYGFDPDDRDPWHPDWRD